MLPKNPKWLEFPREITKGNLMEENDEKNIENCGRIFIYLWASLLWY